jgi:beta-N-acetylhexosaminidase
MPDYGEGDKAKALKAALNEQGVTQVTGVLISETTVDA